MRNLKKSNVLISIEPINQTLKKKVKKIILEYVLRFIKVGSFFAL